MTHLTGLGDSVPELENQFLHDLSQLHDHPKWVLPKSLLVPEFTVQYKVNEHHVTAYIVALKAEGFTIHTLSSVTDDGQTEFLIVGRKVNPTNRVDYDFVFKHGMDYRQLLTKKMEMEVSGYNMTLLHSYESRSHYQHYCFAAVFRYEAFTTNVQMKYGTAHLPEPYNKLVEMYHQKHFYPLSQTVLYHGGDERFSFVYIKRPNDVPINFMHHYDLSPKKLRKLTGDYLLKDMPLSYLNTYEVKGKYRFAAIFSNATFAPGVLEMEQSEGRATASTIKKLNNRMVPMQMVPYIGSDKGFKVAVFYQEV